MWIVYVGGDKHSVWGTIEKSKKQKRILTACGYKDVSFEFDENADYPDGYYFV
jgi:hypothetical protein